MCWQARFIHTGITLVGRTRGVKDGRRGQINLRDVQSRLRHTGTRLERLRVPLIRERKNDASWNEATWDQAMDFIAGRLDKIRREYGAQSIASYRGQAGAGLGSIREYMARFMNVLVAQQVWARLHL